MVSIGHVASLELSEMREKSGPGPDKGTRWTTRLLMPCDRLGSDAMGLEFYIVAGVSRQLFLDLSRLRYTKWPAAETSMLL